MRGAALPAGKVNDVRGIGQFPDDLRHGPILVGFFPFLDEIGLLGDQTGVEDEFDVVGGGDFLDLLVVGHGKRLSAQQVGRGFHAHEGDAVRAIGFDHIEEFILINIPLKGTVLSVFKAHGINLTNIESRPSKKREWEYHFFVDLLGHRTEERVQSGLDEARQHCLQLSVLGSFPRAMELL
jgi:hypothetical protein